MPPDALARMYGDLLIVRPPVPATCNKAGANYKSEVTHLEYAPRRAYDEWLAILDGIVAFGGDAALAFEPDDEPLLDHAALEVDGAGLIRPAGAREVVGDLAAVLTGRVFTANGPWVTVDPGGRTARGVMPHMLPHRRAEAAYFRDLLGAVADASGLDLALTECPYRWEGMADVAVVGDRVVLTYAVAGHYDAGLGPRSLRSSRDGVAFAADHAGVPERARVYVELVYPHFHGDTVHFTARPPGGPARLVHFAGGLWGDGHDRVVGALGPDQVVPIDLPDAVHQYAGNSRQVGGGVLMPDGVSARFQGSIERLGLTTRRIPLFELFGKAGGGPACTTLQLPAGIDLPAGSPLRYSASRDRVRARRERLPERLTVSADYFAGRARG